MKKLLLLAFSILSFVAEAQQLQINKSTGKITVVTATGTKVDYATSADVVNGDNTRVPTTRTITIDGNTYTLNANLTITLTGKQNTLVSGTNIKTVNGNSLLGSGDLAIAGGSATTDASLLSAGTLSDQRLSANVTQNTVVQTLTNKTLSGASNTFTAIPQSAVTNLSTDIAAKQATLVSGTNIKTVNGNNLLGSGDITIAGGSATTDASLLSAGTLSDQRLSTNVTQNAATQTLTNKTLASPNVTGTVPTLSVNTLTVNTGITGPAPALTDSSGAYITSGWYKRLAPVLSYNGNQFTYTDSLSIKVPYIRNLFSGTGYDPATGIISGGSSVFSTSATVAYYNAGSVGIGTNTPYKKFTVEGGDILVSGGLYFKGIDNSATDVQSIRFLQGSGIQIMGGAIHAASGIYYTGNMNLIADGNLYLKGANRDIFTDGNGTGFSNGTGTNTSRVYVNGAIGSKVSTITAATTLDITYSTVLANGTTAAFTVTLPDASTCSGREYELANIGTANAITLAGFGGTQNINGTTTFGLATQYKYVKVKSTGSATGISWIILASN